MFTALGKVIEAIVELSGAVADLLASVAESFFEFIAWPIRLIARFLRWIASKVRSAAYYIRKWFISGRELSPWANVLGWLATISLIVACGAIPFFINIDFSKIASVFPQTATSLPKFTPSLALSLSPTETLEIPLTPSPTVSIPIVKIKPTETTIPTIPSTQQPVVTQLSASILEPNDTEMILIPAGKFIMGSEGFDGEHPVHEVFLDAYYIDKFEVSNQQFIVFLNETGNKFESNKNSQQNDQTWKTSNNYSSHPVMGVNWFGAQAYCEWRGARLPTEAEWEKAARGEDERKYPWGNEDYSCSLANYPMCIRDSVPVNSYNSGMSPYGIFNMVGNAREWTADWYDGNYYQITPMDNPSGPTIGDKRSVRGGFWEEQCYRWYCDAYMSLRVTFRYGLSPSSIYNNSVGFRCARFP